MPSFAELGLVAPLVEALTALGYQEPTMPTSIFRPRNQRHEVRSGSGHRAPRDWIEITDRFALVDLPEERIDQVIKALP